MRYSIRRTALRKLSLLLMCIASLLTLSSLATAVYAVSATIQLSPDNGPPNTVVTVTGKAFGVQETVIITFDGQQVATATTNGRGSFKAKFTVPGDAQLGFHLVQATGQTSGLTARATFEVQYQWKVVRSPKSGFLQGVAALSANNVWTVGSTGNRTLTEHWNGSSWTFVPSPGPGSNNSLDSVAAISTSDVWAVGASSNGTLTENWNGSYWTVVPSPSPDSSSSLLSVAAVSSTDVWAVGSSSNGTLIENWNGSSWTIIPSPSPDSSSILYSVAVVSPNNLWAVGSSSSGTLTENWNGSYWTIVSSPSPYGSGSTLDSIAVVSANDIWAVGYGYGGGSNGSKTLAEHWNGSSWKRVPSPSPQGGGTIGDALLSLAVDSTNNVWAVGYYGTGDGFYSPLIENWNGTKWTVTDSASQGDTNPLQGAALVPGSSNVWAVGYSSFFSGPFRTFTEYYG